MKIPIKFRGKSYYDDFYYGSYINDTAPKIRSYAERSHEWFNINVADVAQFCGCDADSNEVYEGDILVLEHDGKTYEYKAVLQPCAVSEHEFVQNISKLRLKRQQP